MQWPGLKDQRISCIADTKLKSVSGREGPFISSSRSSSAVSCALVSAQSGDLYLPSQLYSFLIEPLSKCSGLC